MPKISNNTLLYLMYFYSFHSCIQIIISVIYLSFLLEDNSLSVYYVTVLHSSRDVEDLRCKNSNCSISSYFLSSQK